MLLSSSDTRETLLFTTTAQRELVSMCTQRICNTNCLITLHSTFSDHVYLFKLLGKKMEKFGFIFNVGFQEKGMKELSEKVGKLNYHKKQRFQKHFSCDDDLNNLHSLVKLLLWFIYPKGLIIAPPPPVYTHVQGFYIVWNFKFFDLFYIIVQKAKNLKEEKKSICRIQIGYPQQLVKYLL